MNYSDKDFKDLYQEVLDEVKTLTTHWDPSVSDEADPGVAILKAYTLFIDKLNYAINYKNAQNSVKRVTDTDTAKELFYDLGYQVKGRNSANGEISVKLLSSASGDINLPLFTQFTDSTGKINFTSIRKSVDLARGGSSQLIRVQEGIPTQYIYSGREIFDQNDLTSDLRLPLAGYSNLAENSIVICSNIEDNLDVDGYPLFSDWLNTNENIFTTVETKNLFSVGYNTDGTYYIQFYEDSLPGLSKGVKIWIISSSGYGGNIPANRISRLTNAIDNSDYLVISHRAFTNGSDEETLETAKNNYYKSFGVNNTLIGERDYSETIENLVSPSLDPLVSKDLVTGASGWHNLVEILSTLESGAQALLVKQISATLASYLYVNTLYPYLSDETNYKEAYEKTFRYLTSAETSNLIKKAIFEQKVVSNDIKLVDSIDSIYDKYLYDVCDLFGRIIVDSTEDLDTVKERIIKIICDNFNSSKLIAGEEITEEQLSKVVSDNLSNSISSSFYLDNHRLKKNISDTLPNGENLTDGEKEDLVAREVLKGNISLFEDGNLQVPPGSKDPNGSSDPATQISDPVEDIAKIATKISVNSSSLTLLDNEFIQVYRKAVEDETYYGLGIRYRLVSPMQTLNSNLSIAKETVLMAGSSNIIKTGSSIKFTPDQSLIDNHTVTESSVNPGYYNFNTDYEIQSKIVALSGTILTGSKIYPQVTLLDNIRYNLDNLGVELYVQNGSETPIQLTGIVSISGFESGLTSKVPGTTNPEADDPLLSSSERITKLKIPSVILDGKFYYGLVLENGKTGIELGNGNPTSYLLEEGEHFIYSDSDLMDFVDFGSGTLLELPNGANPIKLDNLVNLETDNLMATGVLEKLDGSLEIVNTEISTFIGDNIQITFTGLANGSGELTIYSDSSLNNPSASTPAYGGFNSLSDTKYLTIDGQDYKDGYYWRGGLIVNTNSNGVYRLSQTHNQDLGYITENSLTPTTYTWVRNALTSIDIFLTFSQALILGTANTSFSNIGLNVSIFTLTLYRAAVSSGPEIEDIGYTRAGGFSLACNFSNNTMDSTDGKNPICQFRLNNYNYLVRVKIKLNKNYNLYINNSLSGSSMVKELNSNILSNNSKINSSGTYNGALNLYNGDPNEEITLYLYLNNYSAIGLVLDGNDNGGLTGITGRFSIEVFNRLENNNKGYNPELFYTEGDSSEQLATSTGDVIFGIIDTYTKSNSNPLAFDYDNRPVSPLNNPTKALQFYDSRHILNRNILTKIDLDEEKLKKNLIVIRRNKW